MILHDLNSVIPVILAAGDSVRMGYPKALLPLESDFFLTRILKIVRAAELGRPIVVLGRSAQVIQEKIDLRQVDIVVNSDPDRGQLSSIQTALSVIGLNRAAAMIWPVDQPLVSVSLVDTLCRSFLSSDALIANPLCNGKRGHPVIFRRDLFKDLMAAPLDKGAKTIVNRHIDSSLTVPTEENGTIRDIDTPSDYEAVCGNKLGSVI